MTTVLFLGLGHMGGPMAANLAAAGHDVTVHNRAAATAERPVAREAIFMDMWYMAINRPPFQRRGQGERPR